MQANNNIICLTDLNIRLEEFVSAVAEKDLDIDKNDIIKLVRENLEFLKNEKELNSVARFIKAVQNLTDFINDHEFIIKTNGSINAALKVHGVCSKWDQGEHKYKSTKALETLRKVKETDEELYLRSLAHYISLNDIYINKLSLSHKELIALAPYLSSLRVKVDNLCNGDFLGRLLKSAANIRSLALKYGDAKTEPLLKSQINNKNLSYIYIQGKHFNENIPNELSHLSKIRFENCSNFNKPFPPNMPNLRMFSLYNCKTFNQPLPATTELTFLSLSECDNFNIFDHSFQTALNVIEDNRTKHLFSQSWDLLSPTERENYTLRINQLEDNVKVFLKSKKLRDLLRNHIDFSYTCEQFPAHAIQLQLTVIEDLLHDDAPSAVVEEELNILKLNDNFHDYIKEILHSCPKIASFMMSKNPGEFVSYLSDGQTQLELLSYESKLALLPLFSPEQKIALVEESQELERRGWLNQTIIFEQYSGATTFVLESIKKNNIDNSDPTTHENLGSIISELLQQISYKTLAALAKNESTTQLMLAYLPFMDTMQTSAVVAQIPSALLLDYLKDKPFARHHECLSQMTALQKLSYLQQDIAKDAYLENPETFFALNELIDLFKQNPSKESYQEIQNKWTPLAGALKNAIGAYKVALNTLKKVMSLFQHEAQLKETTESYIHGKTTLLAKVHNEVESLAIAVETLAKLVPGYEEIPEEFLDFITNEIMENPLRDTFGNVLDEKTWRELIRQNQKNPFNRTPLTESSLTVDQELKQKIELFKKK